MGLIKNAVALTLLALWFLVCLFFLSAAVLITLKALGVIDWHWV